MKILFICLVLVFFLIVFFVFFGGVIVVVDVEVVRVLVKKNDCFKCYVIDKIKKGLLYQKIVVKYKGKEVEGEIKMIKNMMIGLKVKFEDGSEEDYKIIEIKDQVEIKNLVYWIFVQ